MSEKERYEDDEITIDLFVFICDFIKGFKKYWWLFIIICSITAGINFARVATSYSPMYTSKASFAVSTLSGYDEANTSYSFYYDQSTAEQLATLFPYVLSSDVLTGLIKEEIGTDVINGNVSVIPVSKSNLFTIKATSSDPDMAKLILESTLKHIPDVTRYIIGETKLNIIEPVTTPETSYNKPNYRKQVVMGALVGAVIFVVIHGVYALFRKTIRKENDFKDVLNIRCLVSIPRLKFKQHNKDIDTSASVLNERVGRGFVEIYKSLALKIQRVHEKTGAKVIMITSTLPDEGKTTVAMNLALSLKDRNKRVLLMDMDLRKPALAKALGLNDYKGKLLRTLTGKKTIEAGVSKLEQGIYFTCAEKPVKNVARLITGHVMKELISFYRNKMDYIIIDAPPCDVINDASSLAPYCDGIIYVIRQDFAKQSHIIDGLKNMMDSDVPILGGILNGVESSFSGYGYHYYGYGYNKYGYGKYGRYGYSRYGYGKYGKYGYSGYDSDKSEGIDHEKK